MTSKMLIDASHPEETRVVVTKGNRVEEFDFESALRKQLRGNIYLAKVTRVEPSLQAAFVDFGGNRHGFLAFSEIHPDYYQIPVADRQALLDDEARAASRDEDEESEERRNGRRNNRRRGRNERPRRHRNGETVSEAATDEAQAGDGEAQVAAASDDGVAHDGDDNHVAAAETVIDHVAEAQPAPSVEDREQAAEERAEQDAKDARADEEDRVNAATDSTPAHEDGESAAHDDHGQDDHGDSDHGDNGHASAEHPEEIIDQIGGDDAMEEMPQRAPNRSRRQYKIQEVIKRRQILLVQVVKEERGNKGAALTTYLSLAGRYSVLMPNTARGGGISRKITSADDRKRLKSIATELEVPEGMGVILRTAGASRTKVEVKRDFEYLMRLWESVRELTLQSTAPALVYEEGSLVKRAIRDLYSKEVEEVQVSGDDGYREAKDFMKMLMPSHAKMVKHYREPQPLFARFGVEQQLDAMFNNVVTLRSGGYIVINQTEALVSIDVNSGRSTREHNIEDTALRTNLEAAEEVARQLRLRDLAGLIVIDFIDMEEKRNNRAVERKISDCLKNDRARIQLGRISHFGLLEMSRQRIRTGVLESSTSPCPHCAGTGLKRATASIALNLVRALEEALLKNAAYDIVVRTPTEIALYVLNHKREMLMALESRFGVHIAVRTDESILAPQYYLFERGELSSRPAEVKTSINTTSVAPINAAAADEDDADVTETEEETEDEATGEEAEGGERGDARSDNGKRKRRRRRRRGAPRDGEAFNADAQDTEAGEGTEVGNGVAAEARPAKDSDEEDGEGEDGVREAGSEDGTGEDRPRRRRRRRGGRRNRREDGSEGAEQATGDDQAEDGETVVAGRTIEITTSRAAAQADGAVSSDAIAVEETEVTAVKVRRGREKPVAAPDTHVVSRAIVEGDEGPIAASNPYNVEVHKPTTAPDTHDVSRVMVEGDEGPIATSNPFNQAHEEPAPKAKKPAPVIVEEPEVEDPNRPKRTGWWAKAKQAISGN